MARTKYQPAAPEELIQELYDASSDARIHDPENFCSICLEAEEILRRIDAAKGKLLMGSELFAIRRAIKAIREGALARVRFRIQSKAFDGFLN